MVVKEVGVPEVTLGESTELEDDRFQDYPWGGATFCCQAGRSWNRRPQRIGREVEGQQGHCNAMMPWCPREEPF